MVDAGMAILEELRSGEGKLERGYMENDQKADRWLDLVDCLRDITEGKVSGHPKYTSEYQRMLTGDRGIDIPGASASKVDQDACSLV